MTRRIKFTVEVDDDGDDQAPDTGRTAIMAPVHNARREARVLEPDLAVLLDSLFVAHAGY